jgi:hypothetical protein
MVQEIDIGGQLGSIALVSERYHMTIRHNRQTQTRFVMDIGLSSTFRDRVNIGSSYIHLRRGCKLVKYLR